MIWKESVLPGRGGREKKNKHGKRNKKNKEKEENESMRLRNIPGAKEAIQESKYVVHQPQKQKGRWKQAFASDQPIHIEVGMGKGRFLMDMARLHPEINYVGIEMYDSVLLRALQKREELENNGETLSNLLFMCVDASNLPDIFEKEEVSRIYLNFSDPWPKARHGKRRLTSREFLARYDQILKKDGTLEFKTDNRPLFDFSLEEVQEIPIEEKEDLSYIREAVRKLPDKYKSVIYLFYYEGYTAVEIAGILHKKENTIYTWMNRGRQMLKEMVGGDVE